MSRISNNFTTIIELVLIGGKNSSVDLAEGMIADVGSRSTCFTEKSVIEYVSTEKVEKVESRSMHFAIACVLGPRFSYFSSKVKRK